MVESVHVKVWRKTLIVPAPFHPPVNTFPWAAGRLQYAGKFILASKNGEAGVAKEAKTTKM